MRRAFSGSDGTVRMLFVNRGTTAKTASGEVLGQSGPPTELRVFDDPALGIQTVTPTFKFTVPAESLVLASY